jgi:glycerol-3-phosphate acyltransferase PlsY
VSAVVGGVVLAIQVVVTGLPPALLVFALVGPILIWLFHLDNIGRLLRGEERKFGLK